MFFTFVHAGVHVFHMFFTAFFTQVFPWGCLQRRSAQGVGPRAGQPARSVGPREGQQPLAAAVSGGRRNSVREMCPGSMLDRAQKAQTAAGCSGALGAAAGAARRQDAGGAGGAAGDGPAGRRTEPQCQPGGLRATLRWTQRQPGQRAYVVWSVV